MASETSAVIRSRVERARDLQVNRSSKMNAQLDNIETEKVVLLQDEHRLLLDRSMDRLNLSARAYHRILRVARTIGDLDDKRDVSVDHLSEAIAYRNIEKYSV